jgi:hypothetical protein
MSPPTATIDRTPALGRPSAALVPLQPGDRVDVRNRFDGRWTTGFRVDAVVADDDGYRFKLRRLSDGAVLPALFDEDTVVGVR